MSASLALAVFNILLLVCPRDFRRAYRAPMRRDFGEAFREEYALHGAFGSLGYTLGAYADLIATGLHERGAMILRDLVYAVRTMARAPLLAAVIIATLALAIAANAAVFSVLGSVLLKPLPYPDPQRLVAVWEQKKGGNPSSYSYPNFVDVRAQNTSFTAVAAIKNSSATLTGRGRPRALRGLEVSTGYFDVIGIKPQAGRFFTAPDERLGSAPAIVLSYTTFAHVFNGDTQALRATAILDGVPYTVVGVTPAGFLAPDPNNGFLTPDYFTVIRPTTPGYSERGMRFITVIARLRPGATVAGAGADVGTILSRLSAKYLEHVGKNETGSVTPLDETILGPVRPLLYGVFAAVGALLLVACANVANLLLSRAARRERELAVRFAVGASRGRIVAQILTETLVYAVIGGIAGVFLAIVAVREFVALRPRGIPRLDAVTFDATAALYTFLIVGFCTLAAGVIPAFSLSRIRLGDAIKAAGRGGDRNRGARARNAFVVAEIAVTLALVVASGLVVRSFFSLVNTPLGFDPTGVTTYTLGALPEKRYGKPALTQDFHQRVRAKVMAIPGVIDASWSVTPPFSSTGMSTSFEIEGHPAPPGEPHIGAVQLVGSSYFNVLRIPLVRGRLFNDGDRAGTTPVMIVTEAFAREFFGTLDVVGKRVTAGVSNGNGPPPVRTIVGVAADTRRDYAHPPVAAAYINLSQVADDAFLIVRAQPHADVTGAVMATIPRVDPLLDQPTPKTLVSMMSDNVAQTRISAIALSVLAAIALFLAIAGVYGVVSYSVAQRTHEFGVRMALGARAGHIIRSVLAGAGRLATIGILVGLVLAALAARVVKAQLYGVGEIDPLTYGVVVLILIAAALVAALIPAIRATRVDPIVALRYE